MNRKDAQKVAKAAGKRLSTDMMTFWDCEDRTTRNYLRAHMLEFCNNCFRHLRPNVDMHDAINDIEDNMPYMKE